MTEEGHKDFSEQAVQQRFEAIGKELADAGLYAEAVEAYKELLRAYPGSRWAANAYLAVAHCYHAMGQEEDELQALEDVIAQFPDHVVAKRAQGAIAALRERHRSEGVAGADLHGAVRRLTRQVERMRQSQRRRAWMGALAYLALAAVVAWVAAQGMQGGSSTALDQLGRRVTALESTVQAVRTAPAIPAPASPPPTAVVTPVTPVPAPAPPPTRVTPQPAPRTSRPAPPPPPATRVYTVKDGDSLWSIAARELGDGRRGDEVGRLNGLKPPYNIHVGDKLKLPRGR